MLKLYTPSTEMRFCTLLNVARKCALATRKLKFHLFIFFYKRKKLKTQLFYYFYVNHRPSELFDRFLFSNSWHLIAL